VSELLPSPENARESLPNLESLAATIATDGLTTALTVVPAAVYGQAYKQHADEVTKSGRPYVVIHGHRRLAAAEMAGLDVVPIMLRTEVVSIRIAAMLENQAREPLTPIEEGQEYKLIMDEEKLSQRSLATRLSVSQTTISHRIALLDLTAEAQAAVKFAATVAVKLTPALQKALVAGELDVEEATRLARLPADEQIWPPEEPAPHSALQGAVGADLVAEASPADEPVIAEQSLPEGDSGEVLPPAPAPAAAAVVAAPVPPQREEPVASATAPATDRPATTVPDDAVPTPARRDDEAKVIAGQSPEPTKTAVQEARGYIPITTAEAIAQAMMDQLTSDELQEVLSYLT
jgi:ParB family chromosome partitioning protein